MSYSLWILIEIASMAAFYSLFGLYFLDEDRTFIDTIGNSIRNTALIILLPYTFLWLYQAYKDKIDKLAILEKNKSGLSEISSTKRMLPFHDEKGSLKFSILTDDLLYLEAADNYVQIHYIDNNKNSKFLIRNSLKKLEEVLPTQSLVRCHRSYIVNFEKVKIIRKERDSLYIDLDCNPPISLPASKTYVPSVMEAFSKYTD